MAPLAGRPPFATDEPDSVYATSQPQVRYRQPPKDDPNARTSAYNHYDGYLNNGYDDSSDGAHGKHAALAATVQPVPQQAPVPLLAPKPGYAAPIAALSMPQSLDTAQFPPGINPPLARSDQHGAPRMPPAAVRARIPPPTQTQSNEVKWGPEPIIRGNSEEKLIPRRGEKGDDFWRRFSMIAKEENKKRYSQKLSPWLRETQSGKKRMSGWVWVVGLILLVCAGLGIGLGLYISHKSPSHQDPTAFGGGGNHGTGSATSQVVAGAGTGIHSSSRHVSPTNTVARRAAFADPLPTPAPGTSIHVIHLPHRRWDKPDAPRARHQRRHLNRVLV
ncbi:hypothetical protein BJY52DRAFT_1244095 [Lactarius psammicola]|nr:hypothetical protein BJY52DRAFT_1244095 [Lactarius psammicola]